MGFFKKEIVERKKSVKKEGERKPRTAVDFTLIHSEQNGTVRDTFTVSQSMFDEMGLAEKCVAIWNNPNAFVVLSESAMLVDAGLLTAYRGKGGKSKSRNFGSPELIKDLIADGTIPTVRELRFKANFELVKVEDITAYVDEANNELEGSGEEIESVYVIQHLENTTFEARVSRKNKEGDDEVDELAVENVAVSDEDMLTTTVPVVTTATTATAVDPFAGF